jgi:hypothetical protein
VTDCLPAAWAQARVLSHYTSRPVEWWLERLETINAEAADIYDQRARILAACRETE